MLFWHHSPAEPIDVPRALIRRGERALGTARRCGWRAHSSRDRRRDLRRRWTALFPYTAEQHRPASRRRPPQTALAHAEAPAEAEEPLNVAVRIGDVAYVTTLAQPTRDWRAVEAIFSDDPGLTRTVVVHPSQVGGSDLIRRDERAGAPPPRRRGRRRR